MDARLFRNTLGHFATGITIITATGEENQFVGLTANAFSSLSLDPPLILVCIDKGSSTVPVFTKGRPFVVNILQEGQEAECWKFAKKGEDKFSQTAYQLSDAGVPVLDSNLATIHCTVHELLEGGDHYILTGLVHDVSYDEAKQPLLFFRGKVKTLNEPAASI